MRVETAGQPLLFFVNPETVANCCHPYDGDYALSGRPADRAPGRAQPSAPAWVAEQWLMARWHGTMTCFGLLTSITVM